MTAPRLEIHLDRIEANTRALVERLGLEGIAVTGVTKAAQGSPQVAKAMRRGGVKALAESRVEHIEALRIAGITTRIVLLRSPMVSQAGRVVASANLSLNTEIEVIARLSTAAVEQHRTHQVLLMVELGDRREGIMPRDVESVARKVMVLPGIRLHGIGTNLACQSGVVPDAANMGELSRLATSLDATLGTKLQTVSGGNSANLGWAFGPSDTGRINDLRLGESILLGRDPLRRQPIEGLRTDAFTLVGEVIEAKVKPSQPRGRIEQSAFGLPPVHADRGEGCRVIVALGRQDVDPGGLTPPPGYRVLGASSDHLVLDAGHHTPRIGAEITFGIDYSALLRAMTSDSVARSYTRSIDSAQTATSS